jgi:7,8-dihydro-6-hydroxymethylpterin-pyrophosphokinase
MVQRSFVLLPMAEIAPNLIHPELRKSMTQLLQDLSK